MLRAWTRTPIVFWGIVISIEIPGLVLTSDRLFLACPPEDRKLVREDDDVFWAFPEDYPRPSFEGSSGSGFHGEKSDG